MDRDLKSRSILLTALLILTTSSASATNIWKEAAEIPATKSQLEEPVPDSLAEDIDKRISCAMKKWQIPGAQVAITRNDKTIFSHAYGYANLESRSPVHTDSTFRIASISKLITAVAIMRLVQDGKLNLNDKVFSLLPQLLPGEGNIDPRIKQISVQDLLNMSPGWNHKKRGESLFLPGLKKIANNRDTLCPPDLRTICQFELAKPLDWSPSTHFSYSNFAYALLGEIVAKQSAEPYVDFCTKKLFEPLSIKDIYPAARLESKRQTNEVTYYAEKFHKPVQSIFSMDVEKKLPAPYCVIDIERYTSSFGWVTSAESLLHFADKSIGYTSKFDASNHAGENDSSPGSASANAQPIERVLTSDSLAKMFSRPQLSDWSKSSKYVAASCTLSSTWNTGKADIFKDGTINGSRAFLICHHDGISCCALFNARTKYKRGDPFMTEIMKILNDADLALQQPGNQSHTRLPSKTSIK